MEIEFIQESGASRANLHSVRVNGKVWGIILETDLMLEIHVIGDGMWMIGETKSWQEAKTIISEYIAGD